MLLFAFVISVCNHTVLAQEASFWGSWEYGGEHLAGSVYKINPTGRNYIELHSFKSTIGEWPKGALCQGVDGVYYGVADGGIYRGGIIFEFRPVDNSYRVLYQFDRKEGRSPAGGLVIQNNVLYGVTYEGGDNLKGTVFGFDLSSNTITVLHHFDGPNRYSNIGKKTALTLYQDKLFGLTENGGEFDKGMLYSVELNNNAFVRHVDFNDNTGISPIGLPSL